MHNRSISYLYIHREPNQNAPPAHYRFRHAVAKLDEVIYAVIRERRASGEDRGHLLSMLLHVRDEDGSGMIDKQSRHNLHRLRCLVGAACSCTGVRVDRG